MHEVFFCTHNIIMNSSPEDQWPPKTARRTFIQIHREKCLPLTCPFIIFLLNKAIFRKERWLL